MVLQLEVGCGNACVVHFVIALCIETNGKGLNRFARYGPQNAGDRRTIRSTTEKAGEALATDFARNCFLQQGAKLLPQLIKRLMSIFGERGRPVMVDRQFAVLKNDKAAGGEPVDSFERRSRRGDNVKVQVIKDALWIQFRVVADDVVGPLTDMKRSLIDAVTKWICAEAVAKA